MARKTKRYKVLEYGTGGELFSKIPEKLLMDSDGVLKVLDFGLKVDKSKLIELCGTSESEFSAVATSMNDLCFDVFGIAKEKKDPRSVQGHRELLDALPSKRKREDDGDVSDSSVDDDDGLKVGGLQAFKDDGDT